MKVTIEVDCTPAEARQFFGLPDLQPLQAAVMGEMERRMMAEMNRFSADGMLKSWFSLLPQSPEQMQDAFGKLFPGLAGAKPDSGK